MILFELKIRQNQAIIGRKSKVYMEIDPSWYIGMITITHFTETESGTCSITKMQLHQYFQQNDNIWA